jgi:hypothetical protein
VVAVAHVVAFLDAQKLGDVAQVFLSAQRE